MKESGWYPPGAEFDPNAPWNEEIVPDKEFDVTISQTLSKTVSICTNNYVPGASGCDYEPDDEGGYCAVGWHDPDDTSETNWKEVIDSNGYHTPLELIAILKEYVKLDLEFACSHYTKPYLKQLLEECDNWVEDDFEVAED